MNRNTFFDKKTFNEKVADFKAIPKKEFINESFFLYDKSNTIKRTFITALNKELSIYESFSYFSGKKKAKNMKLIDISNQLKFFVEKKAIRKNFKLHLAYVNGSFVQTIDQKIQFFYYSSRKKTKKYVLNSNRYNNY